jgi:hypothetical protein
MAGARLGAVALVQNARRIHRYQRNCGGYDTSSPYAVVGAPPGYLWGSRYDRFSDYQSLGDASNLLHVYRGIIESVNMHSKVTLRSSEISNFSLL